jgi:hypothetical protein
MVMTKGEAMSKTVRITSKDKNIKNAGNRLYTICKRTTSQLMEASKQKADADAPVKRGKLSGRAGGESAIQWTVEGHGHMIYGVLHSTALSPEGEEYSQLLARGTGLFGPYKKVILPKKGKFLAFLKDGRPNPKTKEGWAAEQRAGNVIFMKSSPGMKPNPFMVKALEKTWQKAPLVFERESRAFNEV